MGYKKLKSLDKQLAKLSFIYSELQRIDFQLFELNKKYEKLIKKYEKNKNNNEYALRFYKVEGLLSMVNELMIIHLNNLSETKVILDELALNNTNLKKIMKTMKPFWKNYVFPALKEMVIETRNSILSHGNIHAKKGYQGLNDIVKSHKKAYKRTILALKVGQMYADAILGNIPSAKFFAHLENTKRNDPSKREVILPEYYKKMHEQGNRVQKEMKKALRESSHIYTSPKFSHIGCKL